MSTGVPGAVYDPNPTAPVNGALSSGIGVSYRAVYGPPLPHGPNTPGTYPNAQTVAVPMIGGPGRGEVGGPIAPQNMRMMAIEYPGQNVGYVTNDTGAPVPPNGEMFSTATGWLNKTGQTVPPGGTIYAVK
jgi:hypothetical protein